MIARVSSFVLQGIDALTCEVEADLSPVGLPRVTIVGLPDAAVRESMERVRAALLNRGYRFPQARLTINLAPADVRKEGPVYDLPMALAMLCADGTIEAPGVKRLESLIVAGELALDGRTRPIRGAIGLALLARRLGRRGIVLPEANAPEAAAVDGIEILGAPSLSAMVEALNGRDAIAPHPALDVDALLDGARPDIDFAHVRGQEAAKRALTVACAGGHNVIMLGPAGTGKTMMAKALPGVLPPLSRAESLEVTRIYSSAGQLAPGTPLVLRRPVRSPHHTASSAAIIGGGSIPRPGDVSLAHRGVLFLDEMPEFSRPVLETLRQPMEDGCVTIARANGSVRFPARFMLVGAMNPTQDGDAAPNEFGRRATARYLGRLSGPLVDRVDVHVEVPAVPFRELTSRREGTSTATIRDLVARARAVQHARQGARTNGELSGAQLDRVARLEGPAALLVEQAVTDLGLSARAYDKIRRVARTIADLAESESIDAAHVAEAVQYRLLDRPVDRLARA